MDGTRKLACSRGTTIRYRTAKSKRTVLIEKDDSASPSLASELERCMIHRLLIVHLFIHCHSSPPCYHHDVLPSRYHHRHYDA